MKLISATNLREVADRHPGVRREREARKRGPRHRFWPSVAAARAVAAVEGCRGLRFRVGGVTKIEDRRPKTAIPRGRGHKNGRSGAAKRPFRVGGATKVGDPALQNGHSAWEGPHNLYIRNLPIVRLWRLLLVRNTQPLDRIWVPYKGRNN